jgi:XRE family transcriptional regulator, regulator of sulfur utilization
VPPSDTPDPRLADAIRRLRKRQGLTQEEVASRSDMSLSAYTRVERGASNPTWTTIVRVAGALEVEIVELAKAISDDDGLQE